MRSAAAPPDRKPPGDSCQRLWRTVLGPIRHIAAVFAYHIVFLIMHAKNTVIRNPLPAFIFQEFFHPVIADVFKIFNFAHTISGPVPAIQMP